MLWTEGMACSFFAENWDGAAQAAVLRRTAKAMARRGMALRFILNAPCRDRMDLRPSETGFYSVEAVFWPRRNSPSFGKLVLASQKLAFLRKTRFSFAETQLPNGSCVFRRPRMMWRMKFESGPAERPQMGGRIWRRRAGDCRPAGSHLIRDTVRKGGYFMPLASKS